MAVAMCVLAVALTVTFSEAAFTFNDKASLLIFKNSISHDPSNILSSWDPNISHCSWYGVTCDNKFSNRVIALNLSHNSFSGEISASIGNLQFLKALELQGNNFSGEIPNQISNLGSLSLLNLSFNSLSGEIPGVLIGYGKLRVIDLSNNNLGGAIRVNSSCECLVLRHLKLSNNVLEKVIPGEIGKCKNLRTLLLDGNLLQGPVPPEIGQISELRVLDVSTNSLNGRIPKELANCQKLGVLVLTNSCNFGVDGATDLDYLRFEFNAFDEGGIPYEVFTLPSLQILWAPRVNLHGELPGNWSDLCSLRVIHLGQNSFTGVVPEGLGMCKNLVFLDLSSNHLVDGLPKQLQVPCMTYFNVSRNNLTGVLPSFEKGICNISMISYGKDPNFLDVEDIQIAYSSIPVWGPQMTTLLGSMVPEESVIVHDFSRNQFIGLLPSFSVGDEFLVTKNKSAFRLSLNSNMFNGFLAGQLVSNCNDLLSLSVNLSGNHISGEIHELLLLDCLRIRNFEAADNEISGSLGPTIGNLTMLEYFDLRGNRLSGSLPDQLGNLKFLKSILLGGNNLTGEIPSQFGQLTSLMVLDLSHNALTGSIPASLAHASDLKSILLDNNGLSGEIPTYFSNLSSLTVLDVSFNNLSGYIPHLQNQVDCDWFRGNSHLEPCLEAPIGAPSQSQLAGGAEYLGSQRTRKSLIIALASCASVLPFICLVLVLVRFYLNRKLSADYSLREKVVVTFADAPAELSYDSVVRATGNFSVRNLIGTGGFGSTYRAELVPGYLVAVKRLSIGRFQGIQQFDAEIRTLGRIRHKNLVTLIGYFVGEAEMFLIYNFLSGGNLETFIHNNLGKNVRWSVIYKITLDIAQALAYLHYSCKPRILHRDIKPSNILLDEECNAYLSDFGLARLLEVSQTHATTDVAGTFGYVAPEYATTCRVSDKSDVYSFGVVMLEMMSGKKSLDPSFSDYGNGFNIVAWAKMLIKERRCSELFSPELWEAGPRENLLAMLKLASICTVDSLSVRPSMEQVLEELKQLNS